MSNRMVKNFTVDGKCSNCGKCCSNMLPLSKYEIQRIKNYIKDKGIKEQRHNVVVGVDMTCPFRDEANKKCLIYDIRPDICRQFMCNHTQEEIERVKFNCHKNNYEVFMRNEFFGSTEDIDFFASLMKGVLFSGQYYSDR